MHQLKILLLGGTTEAAALARLLATDPRFAATVSLAGVTRSPRPLPLPSRVGGFGGAAGLAGALREQRVQAVVDATHPFAARITCNAIAAACMVGIPLLAVRRPAWSQHAGDRWTEVASLDDAATALGSAPRRVLLTIGQKGLASFARTPRHHYVIRSVDPPDPAALPVGAEVITATGPFTLADELRLLTGREIQVLVTKNSGGQAVAAKLEAARILGLPVVMVTRPPVPDAETVAGADAAMGWLERHHAAAAARGV